jgi:hypothetical protein
VIERVNVYAFEAADGAVVCGRLPGFRRYVSIAGEHTPMVREGDRVRLRFIDDGIMDEGEVLEVEHLGDRLRPDYHRTILVIRLDEERPDSNHRREKTHG